MLFGDPNASGHSQFTETTFDTKQNAVANLENESGFYLMLAINMHSYTKDSDIVYCYVTTPSLLHQLD